MGSGHLSVFTIPAGIPFARALADGIVARIGRDPLALADVTILVPTRRAVRTLREEFARAVGGALLGPNIRALGDVDEEALIDPTLEDLTLPPAIAPLRQVLLLASMVERWAEARGAPLPFAQAVTHAGELARFLDEATTHTADLTQLKNLAPISLAAHWEEVTKFLEIVSRQWPELLAESNAMENAARRDTLLRRYAAKLGSTAPKAPLFAAGSTGSIPATADLLAAITRLPNSGVILPGLDTDLDEESWAALDPGHPQYGLRELLSRFGIARDDVQAWSPLPSYETRTARVRFLSEAMRPAPTTDAWRKLIENSAADVARALDTIALVEASDPHEEAVVIAVALREALETPEQTAALVTPDRSLGRRVAAELSRWDITIDDSGGTPLSRTPTGAFLSLLARAAAEHFAPIPFLALLKHPFSAAGHAPAEFRRLLRELERHVLHGLRPDPGLSGIAIALARKGAAANLIEWFARLSDLLSPFASVMDSLNALLTDIARLHTKVAEDLAETDKASGDSILWRRESGEAAAGLIKELMLHGPDVALSPARSYADLFRQLAEARMVRPRFGGHPRLAILGPLEARLQSFDLLVLGGLNEGGWPAEAATDPFLSRPMRAVLGLEAPERRLGLAAHDFTMLASGPRVLLTRALKQDGSPTTASRWLLRMKQLAIGLKLADKFDARHALRDWARRLDSAAPEPRAKRPSPKPPVAARPRTLRVTEIETLLRDPYEIYARHVLRLKPLDAIDTEPGPRERGIALHKALERFLAEYPAELPPDSEAALTRLGDEAFAQAGASSATLALWRPRFARAARWFLAYETARRGKIASAAVERSASMSIAAPGGLFTLKGRADRIDLYPDGSAAILDYKTGRPPSQKQMATLLAPQLPLEGAMLLHGAFEGLASQEIRELLHIYLPGGEPAGKEEMFKGDATAIARLAYEKLASLIARYDDENYGYLSRAAMERRRDEGDYDHLARVREWTLLGDES